MGIIHFVILELEFLIKNPISFDQEMGLIFLLCPALLTFIVGWQQKQVNLLSKLILFST